MQHSFEKPRKALIQVVRPDLVDARVLGALRLSNQATLPEYFEVPRKGGLSDLDRERPAGLARLKGDFAEKPQASRFSARAQDIDEIKVFGAWVW